MDFNFNDYSKFTQPCPSKTSLALSAFAKSDVPPRENQKSKKVEPRITRRMTKMQHNKEVSFGKCVICLGSYMDNFGKLTCGHMFCVECVKEWWRTHETCPFCREEILYISTKNGQMIGRSDLPPVIKSDRDEDFIPNCQLCWGQIQHFEEMNICTACRSVYWHRRCLPFRDNKWYCIECAGPDENEEETV